MTNAGTEVMTFGPKVVGDQEAYRQSVVAQAGRGLYGPEDTDPTLADLAVADATKRIDNEQDLNRLRAMFNGELKHRKHEGGRKTILNAVRDRIAELVTLPKK